MIGGTNGGWRNSHNRVPATFHWILIFGSIHCHTTSQDIVRCGLIDRNMTPSQNFGRSLCERGEVDTLEINNGLVKWPSQILVSSMTCIVVVPWADRYIPLFKTTSSFITLLRWRIQSRMSGARATGIQSDDASVAAQRLNPFSIFGLFSLFSHSVEGNTTLHLDKNQRNVNMNVSHRDSCLQEIE